MQKIVMYFGTGVDNLSGVHAYKTLEKLYPEAKITRVKAHQIKDIDWDCDLFVVPGGRDIHYCRAFEGYTDQLRSWVEQGGRYLGICAGGYFGTNGIEFEKDHPLEVIEKRELSFFPGRGVGGALGRGKFTYSGYGGSDLAIVNTPTDSIYAFYNGGCFFENADQIDQIKVLAHYDLHDQPAVVLCPVGKGKALLSGVHFEYIPHLLNETHLSKDKLEILNKHAEATQGFMKECIDQVMS